MVIKIKKIIIRIFCFIFGWGNSKPAVLVYHSVGGNGDFFDISADVFEQQISWLKDNGFAFICLDDLKNPNKLSGKNVLITFDDGYENNFLNAAPILRKYNASAVFFASTGFIGGEFAGLKVMTWDELKSLSRDGLFEIGSHGIVHKRLTRLDKESVENELINSKKTLEEGLGVAVRSFAYPYGVFNKYSVEMANIAGYESAFSGYPDNMTKIKNFYAIPRFSVDDFSKDFFQDFFTGGYGFYWKVRLLFKKKTIPHP